MQSSLATQHSNYFEFDITKAVIIAQFVNEGYNNSCFIILPYMAGTFTSQKEKLSWYYS